MRWMARGAWPLMVLLAVGCESEPQTAPVSGTVTFKGKPLPAGEIFFEPDPTKGNAGPQGYALIKDGVFDTSAGGRGVTPGAQKVRILGFDGKPRNELPLGTPIFPEYLTEFEMSSEPTQQEFTVPADAAKPKKPADDV